MMTDDLLKAITNEMKKRDIDVLFITPGADLQMLLDINPIFCERFQGLFLRQDMTVFYVCNALGKTELQQHLPEGQLYPWLDSDGPREAIRKAFADHDLPRATIGVCSTVRAYDVLENFGDDYTFVSARDLLLESRIYKSDNDLSNLATASRLADQALAATLPHVKIGMTEQQIKEILFSEVAKLGGVNARGIVACGVHSGFPHYSDIKGIVRDGEALLIDYGFAYNNMRCDMTRTFFINRAGDFERKIYDIVLRANLAAEDAVKEGAWIPDIDEAARAVIRDAGYDAYFPTRLGHGIGRLGHEAPDIVKTNCRHLERRMSFTIEPGIYFDDRFGVRIEDVVFIDAAGHKQILNRFPKELTILTCN